MNELVKDAVRVEWEELGEGSVGEYDADDPNDVEFLRFYVSRLMDGEWEAVDDASCCTQVPVTTDDAERSRLLAVIMEGVHDRVMAGLSIKKDCEVLSWLAPRSGTDDLDSRMKPHYGRNLGAIDPMEVS